MGALGTVGVEILRDEFVGALASNTVMDGDRPVGEELAERHPLVVQIGMVPYSWRSRSAISKTLYPSSESANMRSTTAACSGTTRRGSGVFVPSTSGNKIGFGSEWSRQ
ncbi:hypothetical protein [Sorangium sp. So ce1151]|uniref:hypothetical protein n=1 Tax=Sorangium sp. So ce1151 TaxID=3133332 RepID=UPI003F62E396